MAKCSHRMSEGRDVSLFSLFCLLALVSVLPACACLSSLYVGHCIPSESQPILYLEYFVTIYGHTFYTRCTVARVRRQAPPQKIAAVWNNSREGRQTQAKQQREQREENCAYWEAPRRRLSRPVRILQKL